MKTIKQFIKQEGYFMWQCMFLLGILTYIYMYPPTKIILP